MDRATVLLKVEKKAAQGIWGLLRLLEEKLVQEGVLLCPTAEGIQITLPDMILLELRIHEAEQLGSGRSLEMELEWIDGDPPLGSPRLSEQSTGQQP